MYDRIKFSMQLYSQPSLEFRDENKDINTPVIEPEDFDKAFQRYKDSKSQKVFRIETHKHSQTSPFISDLKLITRAKEIRTSKGPSSSRGTLKELPGKSIVTSGDLKKKTLFTIKPKAPETGVNVYSAKASPLGLKKSFKIAPSPGSTTRKKFFINPQPIKSRILDF